MDAKIIQVALSGLENILRLGHQEAKTTSGPNPYALLIEECYGNWWCTTQIANDNCLILVLGLDKIEFLQSHENMEIYQKAFNIIETYFGSEEEDTKLAPSVDPHGQQFNFSASEQQPPQSFDFWALVRNLLR